MIRLVLMGNEKVLRSIGEKITGAVKGAFPVEAVEMDMEEEREASFDEAVDKACIILGNLDAFVHCYTYEGNSLSLSLSLSLSHLYPHCR
jgi:hypothetical protein